MPDQPKDLVDDEELQGLPRDLVGGGLLENKEVRGKFRGLTFAVVVWVLSGCDRDESALGPDMVSSRLWLK